jgi:hypothetical protein
MGSEVPARGLTAEQVTLLLQMIHESRVRQHKGNDHVEAWDVRRWLTRIFGFAGWSEECLSETCVYERIVPQKEENKFRATVAYKVILRLHIRDIWGNEIGFFDQGSVGESVNQPSIGDAHDNALKNAFSQALKRCAIDLGDQFGLSLYNKGRRDNPTPVVMRTLGHPAVVQLAELPDVPVDAPVTGGELDEPGPDQSEALAALERKARRGDAEDDPWQVNRVAEVPGAAEAARADGHGRPAARNQVQAIVLELKKLGIEDHETRKGWLSSAVGRSVGSTNELTFEEARHVLRKFDQPQADRERVRGVAPGEIPRFQGEPTELAGIYYGAIVETITPQELAQVCEGIKERAGELDEPELEVLRKLAAWKQPQLASGPAPGRSWSHQPGAGMPGLPEPEPVGSAT